MKRFGKLQRPTSATQVLAGMLLSAMAANAQQGTGNWSIDLTSPLVGIASSLLQAGQSVLPFALIMIAGAGAVMLIAGRNKIAGWTMVIGPIVGFALYWVIKAKINTWSGTAL